MRTGLKPVTCPLFVVQGMIAGVEVQRQMAGRIHRSGLGVFALQSKNAQNHKIVSNITYRGDNGDINLAEKVNQIPALEAAAHTCTIRI